MQDLCMQDQWCPEVAHWLCPALPASVDLRDMQRMLGAWIDESDAAGLSVGSPWDRCATTMRTTFDPVSAELGACTSMTVLMRAARKGWPLEPVLMMLWHWHIHVNGRVECEPSTDGSIRLIGTSNSHLNWRKTADSPF